MNIAKQHVKSTREEANLVVKSVNKKKYVKPIVKIAYLKNLAQYIVQHVFPKQLANNVSLVKIVKFMGVKIVYKLYIVKNIKNVN